VDKVTRRAAVDRGVLAKWRPCTAEWAAEVLRRNRVVFLDEGPNRVVRAGRYAWHRVAPLEWLLVGDQAIADRLGIAVVSVVAQYRHRHGLLRKYRCPEIGEFGAALGRRDGMAVMRRWLRGTQSAAELADQRLQAAITGLVALMGRKFPGLSAREWFKPRLLDPTPTLRARNVAGEVQPVAKDLAGESLPSLSASQGVPG
jgi:hypothetical protein